MKNSLSGETTGNWTARDLWRASAGGLVAVFVFGGFVNLLKFAMPLYTLQLLDRIPVSGSLETLAMLTAIALPAVLAGVALFGIRRRLLARWGGWLELQLSPRLIAQGLGRAPGDSQSGTAKPLQDVTLVRNFVARSAEAWLDLVWAPLFVVAVFFVHPILGSIQLVGMASVAVLGVMQERALRDPHRASNRAADTIDEMLKSAERHSESLRAHSMAPAMTDRFEALIEERTDEKERADARSTLFRTLEQAVYRSLYVGGLAVGMWLAIAGELSIGGVIAGNIMMRFGFRLVSRPARKWRALVRAYRAYKRIAANLAVSDDREASFLNADIRSGLTLDAVTHRFPGQPENLFRRLDRSAAPGEILCVAGPSGAGKTTLSRILTGVISPRDGRIRVGNIDIARLPEASRAGLIGYLPQKLEFFSGTIRENISRMSEAKFEWVVGAAKRGKIHDRILLLPDGYDTVIDEEASIFSGGERKRIALARAYFGKPHILVLDVPEANLDRQSRKALIRALKHFRDRGSVVVVTTQTTKLARFADKVLLLGGRRPEIIEAEDDAPWIGDGEEAPASSANRPMPLRAEKSHDI
jgi:ATP-binding cassette subfamily C exporter for protease/lipase